MNRRSSTSYLSLFYGAAFLALLVVSLWLRLSDLDSDPPLYFDGSGQSLSTDPYQYTYHARNKILFDDWDPLLEKSWKIFQYSLVSGLSYLIFLISDVSRANANLVGVILSVIAILLFIMALRKTISRTSLLAILFFLLCNQVLFVYGRLPYLENGLLFWSALLFYLFVNFRQSSAGLALLGVSLALAALTGKIFGLILAVPLAGGLWIDFASRRRPLLILLGSFLATSFAFGLIFYGGNLKEIFSYLFMQSYGLYGFPEALLSPLNFLERFISLGNESRFYFLSPALGIGGFLGVIYIYRQKGKKWLLDNPALLYLILWLISAQLFFCLGNYRPLRYIYFSYLPLAGIAGYFLDLSDRNSTAPIPPADSRFSLIIFFAALWIFIEQFLYTFYVEIGFLAVYKRLVWTTALPALALTLLEWKFSYSRIFFDKTVRLSLGIFLLVLAGWSFFNGYDRWQKEKSFNIRNAGIDLGEILSPGAVITGPMAPTFLPENRLKGMIYAVGISGKDPDFLKNSPVTHLAINSEAFPIIVEEFPDLATARPVTVYAVRDAEIGLYRICHLTGNRDAAAYVSTDYEIARDFFEEKLPDSASFYIEQFLKTYPDNLSALMLKSRIFSATGRRDDGLLAIEKAATLYPDNYLVLFDLAVYYYEMHQLTGERIFRDLAEETFLKVTAKNPHFADEVAAFIAESEMGR